MFKRRLFKPKPRKVNCILLDGGVGDHMASLVAINYILKHYPWIELLIWTPNFLLDFTRHVLPSTANVRNYTAMAKEYDREITTKTTQWDSIISPMKTHSLDYAFLKLCDENPSIEHKNYLQIKPDLIDTREFQLPGKYVVITAGYTAKVREFRAESINKIARYINDKGYQVVFLGQTKTQTGAKYVIEGNFDNNINFKLGHNLINKTSLLEAAKVMNNAAAVIGVDNGLLHVAGCTQTPIVGGFTTVSPEIRMPVRHNILGWNYYPVIPDSSLGCSFCQEKTNFIYGHDYRNCLYKDNLCTKQMTPKKFIEQLEKIL